MPRSSPRKKPRKPQPKEQTPNSSSDEAEFEVNSDEEEEDEEEPTRNQLIHSDLSDTSDEDDEDITPRGRPSAALRSSKRIAQQTARQQIIRERHRISLTAEAEASGEDAASDVSQSSVNNYCELATSDEDQGDCCFGRSCYDAITKKGLPRKHICWVSPDETVRLCFALETLQQVSKQKMKRKLLQPPHFLSEMEDEMKKQVMKKFGEPALTVNAFIELKWRDDNVREIDFKHHLDKFLYNYIGSRDVYVCPICYIEAERRMKYSIESDEVEDDSPDEESEDFIDSCHPEASNPLAVLASLDEEQMHIAATFSSGKVTDIRHHLKEDHGVDLSDIQGNDLFQRFKLRAPDGLLQRHLKHMRDKRKKVSKQEDMMIYWFQDWHHALFVCLLHEIDTHLHFDQEKVDLFLSSFSRRAKHIWNIVSGPYTKFVVGEDDDFICGDDSVEEASSSEESDNIIADREKEDSEDPEEAFVKQLRQRRGATGDTSSSEGDESDHDASIAESFDTAQYYFQEEEEDEWINERRAKMSKKKKKTVRRKSSSLEASSSKKHSRINREKEIIDVENSDSDFSMDENSKTPPNMGSAANNKKTPVSSLREVKISSNQQTPKKRTIVLDDSSNDDE